MILFFKKKSKITKNSIRKVMANRFCTKYIGSSNKLLTCAFSFAFARCEQNSSVLLTHLRIIKFHHCNLRSPVFSSVADLEEGTQFIGLKYVCELTVQYSIRCVLQPSTLRLISTDVFWTEFFVYRLLTLFEVPANFEFYDFFCFVFIPNNT